MSFQFEGRSYVYDQADITLQQAFVVKAHTGMTLVAWEQAIGQVDPLAVQALWWLILKQNGTDTNIAELDVKPVRLMQAMQKQEQPADPQLGVEGVNVPTPASPTLTSAVSETTT